MSRFTLVLLSLIFSSALISCGGGGSSNANQGWISIWDARADSQNAYLSGSAMLDGTVNWINTSASTSGAASQHIVTSCPVFTCVSVNQWSATIPLTQGANQIQVTASGQSGTGQASITIAWGASFPRVLSTSPPDLANAVNVTSIMASFSEAMDPATINATTFTLRDEGTVRYNPYATPVSGAVAYSGTTATFTPSVALVPSHSYAATITTGAKSVAGYPMLNNFSWNFTTQP